MLLCSCCRFSCENPSVLSANCPCHSSCPVLDRHKDGLPWFWSLSPPSSARAQQWARKKTDWSQDSASFEIPGVQNISSACIPIKGASLGAGIPIPLPLVSRKVAPEKNQLLALQCKSNCPISSHNLLKNLFSFTVPSFLHVELLAPSSHQTFPTLLALLWISCSYLPNKTRQGCGLKSYWISWHKVV